MSVSDKKLNIHHDNARTSTFLTPPRPPTCKIATESLQRVLKNEETNPFRRIQMRGNILQQIFPCDKN